MRLAGCAHTIINAWPKSWASSAHTPAKDFWQLFIASSQYLCELYNICYYNHSESTQTTGCKKCGPTDTNLWQKLFWELK